MSYSTHSIYTLISAHLHHFDTHQENATTAGSILLNSSFYVWGEPLRKDAFQREHYVPEEYDLPQET
jgi:hypothetical protein